MHKFAMLAALGAALVPCASLAEETPAMHVGSIYATKFGSGPTPLLLVPGLGCGPWVWQGFVTSLPANDFTVYEITPAGFDGTPADGRANHFDGYAESIMQLVREQHIATPIVIGHSLGGELALRIAELHPKLVRGLVIVDAFPIFPPLGPAETLSGRRTQWKAIAAKMKSQSDADYAASEQAAIAAMVLDPKTASEVTAHVLTSDRATVVESAYELATTDLSPGLSSVASPTLVLGETGAGYPLDATRTFYQQQYAALAGVRVDVIPNSRHFIMLDQPEAFRKAVLDFVTALTRGASASTQHSN